MPFTEDFSPYFADFGVSAVVGGVSVRGIFDNASQDAFGLVAATGPVLSVVAGDVPNALVNDVASVGAVAYSVADIESDGTGMTRLRLKPRAANGFDNGFSAGFGT